MNPTDAHLAAEGREMPPLATAARLAAVQLHPGDGFGDCLAREVTVHFVVFCIRMAERHPNLADEARAR